MSDSDTNTNTNVSTFSCENPELGRLSDGFVAFAYVHLSVSLFLLAGSLALFYYYRNLPYLKARQTEHFLLLAMAWFLHLVAAPIKRIAVSFGETTFLSSCTVLAVAHAFVIPLVLIVSLVRVTLFHNRVVFNEQLSTIYQGQSTLIGAKHTELGSINSDPSSILGKLRFKATQKYGFYITLGLVLMAIPFVALFAMANCTDWIGNKEECEFTDLGAGGVVPFAIPIVLLAIPFTWITYRDRKYPDPFGLQKEIRDAFSRALVIGLPALILISANVGKFNNSDNIKWNFDLLFDLSLFIFFYTFMPHQIYKALHFDLRNFTAKMGLQSVLESEVGRRLFRQHLVNEFSVENIIFYEAVEAYDRDIADPTKQAGLKAVARNLFKHHLGKATHVNISQAIIERTREKMEAFTHDRRGGVGEGLFQEAQEEVFNLMEADSFQRFQRTTEFREFLGTVNVSTTAMELNL